MEDVAFVIPLHSIHAQRIYSGEKKVEYRKRAPPDETMPARALVYETAPVSAITGWIDFEAVLEASPEKLLSLSEGSTRESAAAYLAGTSCAYALTIARSGTLAMAVAREQLEMHFPGWKPPQAIVSAASPTGRAALALTRLSHRH